MLRNVSLPPAGFSEGAFLGDLRSNASPFTLAVNQYMGYRGWELAAG